MSDAGPNPEQQEPSTHLPQETQGRRESRLDTPSLHCSQGKVADMTGSGMRIIVNKRELPEVGDVQSYSFSDLRNTLTVTGTVKWVRKGSPFSKRCEVGIEFVQLDQSVRDALVRLAVQGKIKDSSLGSVQIQHKDLYAILGVTRYASAEQLREAFHALTHELHPDKNDAPDAAQRFEEVHKAYSVLRDEQQRAKYDLRFADQHDRAA